MMKKQLIVGSSLMILLLMIITPTHVTAQDSLSFSLTRNFGIGIGNTLQGTFTLNGDGPEAIIGLIVYFNGVEVHSVTGNTISWQFNTGDYPSGDTNITLYGWDNDGISYIAMQNVSFLSDFAATGITIGIIALVVVLILFRYVPKIMGRGKRKSE